MQQKSKGNDERERTLHQCPFFSSAIHTHTPKNVRKEGREGEERREGRGGEEGQYAGKTFGWNRNNEQVSSGKRSVL